MRKLRSPGSVRGVPGDRNSYRDRRRTVLQLAAALVASPAFVIGQTARRFRVGYLSVTNESTTKPGLEAFLSGMRDRGYVSGQNLILDIRYPEGDASRLAALADELIALKPDVLLGTEPAARVMAAKTATIPIVLLVSNDPVAAGLVKSLARPGGNVTGVASLLSELLAKQIELLAEIVPKMSRVALLKDASSAAHDRYEYFARIAANAKGLALTVVSARDSEGVRQAFGEAVKARADGVVVAPIGLMSQLRHAIVGEATRFRLPAIYWSSHYVEMGGLVSYSPDFLESYRREAADFVDLILKGAKPAGLPVRQPSRFELVVNKKAAREIGINIPQSILLRADRVIE